MLVWNAIPSMTLMMSTIFFDEAVMESMVPTTLATTAPPRTATSDAEAASWLACCALSAFCFTVEVSSSIDDAVSPSELACCSVREDRSRLPAAISLDAVEMVSVDCWIVPTVAESCCCIACMAYSMLDASPDCSLIALVRSPLEMPVAIDFAYSGSPPMERSMPRMMTITRIDRTMLTTASSKAADQMSCISKAFKSSVYNPVMNIQSHGLNWAL